MAKHGLLADLLLGKTCSSLACVSSWLTQIQEGHAGASLLHYQSFVQEDFFYRIGRQACRETKVIIWQSMFLAFTVARVFVPNSYKIYYSQETTKNHAIVKDTYVSFRNFII